MAIKRMDNVGIVVEDLQGVIDFFRALGLELEGRATVEGEWAGRLAFGGADHVGGGDGGHVDADIDAVEKRPGNAGLIIGGASGAAPI